MVGVKLVYLVLEIDKNMYVFFYVFFLVIEKVLVLYLNVKGFVLINLIYYGYAVDLNVVVKKVYLYGVFVLVDEVYGVYFVLGELFLFLLLVMGVDVVV